MRTNTGSGVQLESRTPRRNWAPVVSLLAVLLAVLRPTPLISASQPQAGRFGQLAAQAQKASDENQLDEAARLYAQALAIRPTWAEGWWGLGTIEYDQNHYTKAAVAFQKLIALQPKNGTAYAMLGLCEFELGRENQSLQHLQKAKSIGLDQGVAVWRVLLYHEGILQQRKGSFEAARETLEQLCLQGGQGDEVANILGMTMLRLTAKNPPPQGSVDAEVVVRIGRAECLAGQKKYDEARTAFEEVLTQHPDFPNIHYAFGLFLLELRDVAGGVEQLKQEIKNNPSNLLARLRIAAVLYKNDSPAGLVYAEEAVKLDPKLGFGHYLLGLLLLDTDHFERAATELEIAEKSFPREAKLYFALGSAYSHMGRRQDAARARATFERLTKEGSGSTFTGDEQKLGKTIQENSERQPGATVPQ